MESSLSYKEGTIILTQNAEVLIYLGYFKKATLLIDKSYKLFKKKIHLYVPATHIKDLTYTLRNKELDKYIQDTLIESYYNKENIQLLGSKEQIEANMIVARNIAYFENRKVELKKYIDNHRIVIWLNKED